MAMFVWADGTVTGSVNVAELESIQKAMKGVGKKRLADLPWPIESAEQLADLLDGTTDDDTEPPKPAKASESKPAKASAPESKVDADTVEALSKVDLPDLLDKATSTKKEKN